MTNEEKILEKRYQKTKDPVITILGLGSLIGRITALRTCPNLINFRLARLDGYRRIFNKTDSFTVFHDEIPENSLKYGCLSAIPDISIKNMIVSAFEIPFEELIYLIEREFEYRLVEVDFKDRDGQTRQGVLCVGDYKDDQECEIVVKSDPVRFRRWKIFKEKYNGPMWRIDILPLQPYLDRCMRYAGEHGQDVLDNFLDLTFIGDGRTIREYLSS